MNKEQLRSLKEEFEDDLMDMGYELVDVDFSHDLGMNFLSFFIYKKEGITPDDTTKASKFISEKLDEMDIIKSKYYLDVSSPDLSRPLKTDRDLERNMGQRVELGFFKKINGSKTIVGKLNGFDGDYIYIENNGKIEKYDRSIISQIKPAVF